ncbi:MAG: dihydroorotate dehydrogenase [Crenarchaeota archaeon]|nr:dihydroorotate dehydrogenase [Thermoproteota archaeon]
MVSARLPGLSLAHPVMNASGILGSRAVDLKRLEDAGAAALVTKSFTREPREGYPTPIAVPVAAGLLNAVGLANPGLEGLRRLLDEAKTILSRPIVVSVAASTPEEAEALARAAAEGGAAAVEVNLSCPHAEKRGLELAMDPDAAAAVVEAAAAAGLPVYAKLGVVDRLADLAGRMLDAGARGLTLINTVRAMRIDVYTAKPILGHGVGGLSGRAIHPIAVRAVYEVYRETGAPIIGVGGVYTWEDAAELILAGARAVQVGTAIIEEGEAVICRIARGLQRWLHEAGYERLEDAVAAAHRG